MSRNNMVASPLRRSGMAIVALLMVAFAVFAIQAWRYTGITHWLGEWQFGSLSVYFPMATALALGLLCTLPPAFTLLIVRERRRGTSDKLGSRAEPPQTDRTGQFGPLRQRNQRLLIHAQTIAGFAFVGAIVFGLKLLTLEERAAPRRAISADQPTTLTEGGLRVAGRIDLQHVVHLDRQQALARRDLFIAPLLGQSDGAVRYFVEVRPAGSTLEPVTLPYSGQISREAFPNEAITLFEEAGVQVAPDARILFRSAASLAWPYSAAASQFLSIGLFALLFAILLRWRRRLLEARIAELQSPEG